MRNILQKGFILPATIMLGLGIAIMSTTFLQFTATTSSELSSQNYNALAAEAARAGIAFANSCVEGGTTTWASLTPISDCSSVAQSSSNYIISNSEYRSTYTVTPPTVASGLLTITSTGTVEVLSNGNAVKTYTFKQRTSLPNTVTVVPTATGLPITDVENNETDCAIANGELYCWGSNDHGQIGDNTTTDRGHPTRVQGALAGKTVTSLSVGNQNVCVTADGLPYCWGNDGNQQLGQSAWADVRIPTANIPLVSSGPLNGYYVPDVEIADPNNPAIIWPFGIAVPHAAAAREDGVVTVWGDGGFRQNGDGGCFLGWCSYPSYTTPTLMNGFKDTTAPFSGKKAERLGVSSHDTCFSAIGRMYCAGVEVPLPIQCNTAWFMSTNNPLVLIFNLCVPTFDDAYDMSAKSQWLTGDTLNNKFIDVETFEVSTNVGCMMAQNDFYCVGNGPAVGALWSGSWSPPWIELANVDVTYHDNGDNPDSASFDGLYCIIENGIAKCQGSSWQGGGGIWSFDPITSTGFPGKVPYRIAAGQQHGAVIANGQLYTWGYGLEGVLANGNTGINSRGSAALAGTGGSTPIGTTEGTYASDGTLSSGNGHTCAVANGQMFCWGKNTYGQLGTGTTSEAYVPTAVPSTVGQVVTELTAGSDHTCGISDGQLYCWGRNANGQLGVGNTTDYTTPQLVSAFSGMRVQEVSAGDTGTCAIANGQAYCWGLNTNGQVGDGTTTQRTSPVLVNGGTGSPLVGKSVRKISLGTNHACAVANGDLYCWGSNANGRTGFNTTSGNANPAINLNGMAGSPTVTAPNPDLTPLVTDVSAGSDFTCAVINSTVGCWGNNANGRTGRTGVTTGNTLIPTAISNTYFATKVTAGGSHACALLHGNNSKTNGNLWCWGDGSNGRLGNGSTSGDFPTPAIVGGGDVAETNYSVAEKKSFFSIYAGTSNTCGVAKGQIMCWGNGANGRLGNGGVANVSVPDITSDFRYYAPYQEGPVY